MPTVVVPCEPRPRRPPEHPRWCLQQKPGTLRQKGARTACKANGDLDQSTGEIAKHPSLNSTLGCLKIVDTFRSLKLDSPVVVIVILHQKTIAKRRNSNPGRILKRSPDPSTTWVSWTLKQP